KQYEDICGMLQSERAWRDKFSKNYLAKIAHQVLRNVYMDGTVEKAHEYLDTVIAELDSYKQEHTVYLPIDGIVMAVDELKLGKLILINMSGKLLADYEQQVEIGIMQRPSFREVNEQLLAAWRKDALPILRNKTVAIYTTV